MALRTVQGTRIRRQAAVAVSKREDFSRGARGEKPTTWPRERQDDEHERGLRDDQGSNAGSRNRTARILKYPETSGRKYFAMREAVMVLGVDRGEQPEGARAW